MSTAERFTASHNSQLDRMTHRKHTKAKETPAATNAVPVDLPIGQPVAAIVLDSCVRLLFGHRRDREIAIERPFTIADGDHQTVVAFSPYSDDYPPNGLDLLGQTVTAIVTSATASDDGTLEVRFNSGLFLHVEPIARLHAWTLTTPTQRLSCQPGGGLGHTITL